MASNNTRLFGSTRTYYEKITRRHIAKYRLLTIMKKGPQAYSHLQLDLERRALSVTLVTRHPSYHIADVALLDWY